MRNSYRVLPRRVYIHRISAIVCVETYARGAGKISALGVYTPKALTLRHVSPITPAAPGRLLIDNRHTQKIVTRNEISPYPLPRSSRKSPTPPALARPASRIGRACAPYPLRQKRVRVTLQKPQRIINPEFQIRLIHHRPICYVSLYCYLHYNIIITNSIDMEQRQCRIRL